jgi:DUF1365 family protein
MTSKQALFPAPSGSVSLYVGDVMHARMKPLAHRFRYRVFAILVDLDRLFEADGQSRLFSVNRRNIVSFHEADHGPRDGSRLRAYVDGLLSPAGVDITGGRVLLMCYPRIAGFVFNPISVYFAYGRGGDLAAVIYEVRNTFGEHHSYVAPVGPGEISPAGLRQERQKLFYVSPFNGMDMVYRFRLRPPGDELAVRILETDEAGPLLAATFFGRRAPLTSRNVLAALGWFPLLTAKIVGGIHWEALKLWWKGLPLVPRPPAPEPVSYGDPAGLAQRAGNAGTPSRPMRHKPLDHATGLR